MIGAAAGLWARFGPDRDDEIKRREAAAAAALAASAAAAVKVEPPPPAAPPSLLALDLAGLWQLDVDGKRRQLRITREGNALVAAVEGVPYPSGEVNWKTAGQLDVTPDQLIFLDTGKRFKVTLVPTDGAAGRRWTASILERRRSEEELQPVAEGIASVSADGREWAATMKFGEGKTADYFAKLSADGSSVATGMRADGQNRETLNFVRVKP